MAKKRAKYIVNVTRCLSVNADGEQGGWWRLISRNGEILAHSEVRTRYREARRIARQIVADLKGAVLRETEQLECPRDGSVARTDAA